MATGIQRGIDNIDAENERKEKEYQENRKPYIPALNLGQGAIAQFWIMSDPITYQAHRLNDDEKKRTYYRYCVAADGNELCNYCKSGHKPQKFFSFWVFVETKLNMEQSRDAEHPWPQVQYRGKAYFEQKINRPMLLRRGMGRNNATYDKFKMYYLENGTFMDRPFVWSRNVTSDWRKTNYDLLGKDPMPMPENITRIIEEMPDIADAIIGTVDRLPRFDSDGYVVPDDENEESRQKTSDDSKSELVNPEENDGDDDLPW